MTNLAWIIYFASVADEAKAYIWVTSIMTTLATLGLAFFYFSADVEFEFGEERLKTYKKPLCILTSLTVALYVINVLLPNKTTIMTIAASIYGEQIYGSKDVQEIVDPAKMLIKKWIENQLKGMK
jgi:hypothetical protein